MSKGYFEFILVGNVEFQVFAVIATRIGVWNCKGAIAILRFSFILELKKFNVNSTE